MEIFYFDYLPKDITTLIINYTSDDNDSLLSLLSLYNSGIFDKILTDPKFWIHRIKFKLPLINIKVLGSIASYKGLGASYPEDFNKFVYELKSRTYIGIKIRHDIGISDLRFNRVEDCPIDTFDREALSLLGIDDVLLDKLYNLSSKYVIRLVFNVNNKEILYKIYTINNIQGLEYISDEISVRYTYLTRFFPISYVNYLNIIILGK